MCHVGSRRKTQRLPPNFHYRLGVDTIEVISSHATGLIHTYLFIVDYTMTLKTKQCLLDSTIHISMNLCFAVKKKKGMLRWTGNITCHHTSVENSQHIPYQSPANHCRQSNPPQSAAKTIWGGGVNENRWLIPGFTAPLNTMQQRGGAVHMPRLWCFASWQKWYPLSRVKLLFRGWLLM